MITHVAHNIPDREFRVGFNPKREMIDLIEALFCEVNPIPVKTAMNLMGREVGPLRGPLCEMEEKNLLRLKKALEQAGLMK